MSFQSTPEGVQKARQALFQCANSFLEPKTPKDVESLQKQLSESFHRRLDFLDNDSMSRISMAHALLFTDEDRSIMMKIIEAFESTNQERSWFGANVDQANHFIKVLVGGNVTTYPDVDGPSYSDASGDYTRWLRGILLRMRARKSETAMLDRFSAVAEIHYVNDQGRFAENLALQNKENADAIQYAQSIDFAKWQYGAVVVVGHSPTTEEAEQGKACSQMTMDKLERSIALNTKHNLAPLYIFCGGSVRPQLTLVNEAYSMKKYAMEKFNIPEHQILIDATSEHTYSNFMNAVLVAREAKMPHGTRLVAFFVPDRYGEPDQYEWCANVNGLSRRAAKEVYPPLAPYFSIENGKEERSIDIVLSTKTQEFLSPTLLWQDYTRELRIP